MLFNTTNNGRHTNNPISFLWENYIEYSKYLEVTISSNVVITGKRFLLN